MDGSGVRLFAADSVETRSRVHCIPISVGLAGPLCPSLQSLHAAKETPSEAEGRGPSRSPSSVAMWHWRVEAVQQQQIPLPSQIWKTMHLRQTFPHLAQIHQVHGVEQGGTKCSSPGCDANCAICVPTSDIKKLTWKPRFTLQTWNVCSTLSHSSVFQPWQL